MMQLDELIEYSKWHQVQIWGEAYREFNVSETDFCSGIRL